MNGDLDQWLYVAACVAVPAVWGVFTAWFFGRLDAKRANKGADRPPMDYSI